MSGVGRLHNRSRSRPDACGKNWSRRELLTDPTPVRPAMTSRFGEYLLRVRCSRRAFAIRAKPGPATPATDWQRNGGRLQPLCPGSARPERLPAAIRPFIKELHTMSIFGKIMGAIFGTSATAATPATTPGGSAPAAGSAPVAPMDSVDVAAILDKAVAAKGEKLEWKTSIVDLMKALDIDSSLTARKELAKEL
eukprot:gene34975-46991_t